ncbi:MAG TPA: VCBS repeat-containing protein [Xanthomonadales bacterium]|nr:VCBS repeat-containing protein [Xanthomonadales bacterium]
MKLAIAFALCTIAAPLAAQPVFQEITPASSTYFVNGEDEDFWLSSLAAADVDGDGDLDLVALGFYVVYDVSAEDRLVVLRNDGFASDGSWQLVPTEVPLGALYAGASDLAFGDVDGDGDADLAVASEGAMAMYRNDAGTLVATATTLPAYLEDSFGTLAYDLRSIAFADADNDGDLDLLVPSVYDEENFAFGPTQLLRNEGDFSFVDTQAALAPTSNAQSAWADDDADGDLDLLLTNIDTNGEDGFIRRYRNDGDAGFVGADVLPVTVHHGMTDWADADGDGDLDALVAGNIEEADGTFDTVLRIYRRDGDSFTAEPLALPSAGWLDVLAATWADYDSDGDVDLLLTGSVNGDDGIVGTSEIYGNDGTGHFTLLGVALPAPVTTIGRGGAFAWLDIDGDQDLDYIVSGAYYVPDGNGLVESRAQVFRNVTPAQNAPPSAPVIAAANVAGDAATISWLAASDDHTPAAALDYDVVLTRAGTTTSAQRLPEPGRVHGATQWRFEGLAPGTYDVAVQAVDAAWSGSALARTTIVVGDPGVVFANGFE